MRQQEYVDQHLASKEEDLVKGIIQVKGLALERGSIMLPLLEGCKDEITQIEQLQLVNFTKPSHGMVNTTHDHQVVETMDTGLVLKRKHLDESFVGILTEPNTNHLKLALPSPKDLSHAYKLGSMEGVFSLDFNGSEEGGSSHLVKGKKLKKNARRLA